MEHVIKFILMFIVFLAMFYFLDNMGSGSAVMVSDSDSATLTTTDMFGNKSVCKTETIGYGEYARMITTCN